MNKFMHSKRSRHFYRKLAVGVSSCCYLCGNVVLQGIDASL